VHRSDAGENDRRLILLSDTLGLVDIIAKGARKGGSRLAGASELMVYAQFTWEAGRHRSFLKHCAPITSFPGLRTNYESMMAGIAWCDTIRSFVPFGAPAQEIFELSVQVMRGLEATDDVWPVLVWGLCKLLQEEGLAPEWLICMTTGEKLSKTPVPFDLSVGGPVDDADTIGGQVIWVDIEVLMGLSKLTEIDEPPEKYRRAVETAYLLKEILEYHADKRMLALGRLIQEARNDNAATSPLIP